MNLRIITEAELQQAIDALDKTVEGLQTLDDIYAALAILRAVHEREGPTEVGVVDADALGTVGYVVHGTSKGTKLFSLPEIPQ